MSTATYVGLQFQFWPFTLQRSNFQRQPVKQVVKSEESVKGMIKQVEVSAPSGLLTCKQELIELSSVQLRDYKKEIEMLR